MSDLTREEIESRLKIRNQSTLWFGEFDLFVQGFGRSIEVSITLCENSRTLTERTIQTVNEVANLTREHYEHILRLLFDDAMREKADTSWNEQQPVTEVGPMGWLRRFFRLPNRYAYVAMSEDNPEHPLFGLNTPADIEARIKWESICIDEGQETLKRVAFLICATPWDEEHGREIAICNGEPVGIDQTQLNPYYYSD